MPSRLMRYLYSACRSIGTYVRDRDRVRFRARVRARVRVRVRVGVGARVHRHLAHQREWR